MLRNQALNRKLTHYYKIRGGTDLLPKAFAARLAEKVRYGAPAVRIEQNSQGVKAVFQHAGSHHTVTGDYLICAVPFTIQKNIEVSPAFSVEKQRAIEQLPYLSVSKIFLQSRKRFWAGEGLNSFATTDLPVGQVWDTTYGQPGTRGILQAFPISLHSRRVTGMTERESGLTTRSNRSRPSTPGCARTSRAAYRSAGTRTSGHAGEHTSVWVDGWMQGALESGDRVAREVNGAV